MDLFASVARRLASGFVLFFALWGLVYADGPEGTWQLVMRKLPNGTAQTPPTVQGRFTFKNGVSQLIVFWPTPEGKPASLSELSKWGGPTTTLPRRLCW